MIGKSVFFPRCINIEFMPIHSVKRAFSQCCFFTRGTPRASNGSKLCARNRDTNESSYGALKTKEYTDVFL